MNSDDVFIRSATSADLSAINQVIEASVMSWPLADRLKRLSLTVLIYDSTDLAHYQCLVVETAARIVAIAAWDPDHEDNLFHGLYVHPDYQSKGLGQILMDQVFDAARQLGKSSVVVKAESVSADYFRKLGLDAIQANDPNDYPYMFRKQL